MDKTLIFECSLFRKRESNAIAQSEAEILENKNILVVFFLNGWAGSHREVKGQIPRIFGKKHCFVNSTFTKDVMVVECYSLQF